MRISSSVGPSTTGITVALSIGRKKYNAATAWRVPTWEWEAMSVGQTSAPDGHRGTIFGLHRFKTIPMRECQMFKAIVVITALASPVVAHAQGSSGTGSTSTGLGAPSGPAGPGIRSGGWTQQPGAATNPIRGPTNLTPVQKNSTPPPNAHPTNAQRFSR